MNATAVVLNIILPLLAGMMLGAFYFGGLWWTLRELSTSNRPAILTVVSYFGRLGVALAVLYAISLGGHLDRLLVCLAGFVLVRMTLVRILRPLKPKQRVFVEHSNGN